MTIVVAQLVRDEDLGETYVDGALLTNEAAGLSTEPDLIFSTWSSLQAGRVTFTPKANREEDAIELVGTPDLVVEVLSDSSQKKDLVALRSAYARAGIPEYWIVDARSEDLRFEILLLGAGSYRPSNPAGGPQLSRVLGRTFELSRSRNRMGRWSYRLASRRAKSKAPKRPPKR